MTPLDAPRPELAAAARAFRLRLAGRYQGGIGGRRGRLSGGGQDFVEFRDYAPGDDLRHLDWRSYARSDQLRVRLFEDEVAPGGDVLVDLSPSLGATAEKERALRDLLSLFVAWTVGEGGRARCLELGGGELASIEQAPLRGAGRLLPPAARLRPASVRIVLSDFLVLDDPTPFLRGVAAGAARLFVVQLLDPWEAAPPSGPATTLVDVETGERREVTLQARAIAGYRQRLQRLQDDVRGTVLALGGTFVTAQAAAPAVMCRRDLMPAGIVEPRP